MGTIIQKMQQEKEKRISNTKLVGNSPKKDGESDIAKKRIEIEDGEWWKEVLCNTTEKQRKLQKLKQNLRKAMNQDGCNTNHHKQFPMMYVIYNILYVAFFATNVYFWANVTEYCLSVAPDKLTRYLLVCATSYFIYVAAAIWILAWNHLVLPRMMETAFGNIPRQIPDFAVVGPTLLWGFALGTSMLYALSHASSNEFSMKTIGIYMIARFVALVLIDTYTFVVHMAQHKIKRFRKYHNAHHTSNIIDVFTAIEQT